MEPTGDTPLCYARLQDEDERFGYVDFLTLPVSAGVINKSAATAGVRPDERQHERAPCDSTSRRHARLRGVCVGAQHMAVCGMGCECGRATGPTHSMAAGTPECAPSRSP